MITSDQSPRQFRYIDIIMGVFVTVLVVSNVASSAKIIDLGFSLGGIPMAFDGGTFLFPISYIFGDILTEVYGYRRSRRVIWIGFFCLALASLVFWLLGVLPGEVTWQQYAGDTAYKAILGGMSSGGIVLGSLVAYWGGEFANSYILARLKILTHGKFLWVRTIGSTLVGELVDTVLFVLIATVFGVFPGSLFWTLVTANYLFKTAIEVLMTPVTYKVVNFFKRVESVDYYDIGIDFNPFRI
jgi:uncharacterized integral membrane protein (TIGR00697 family)